MGGGDFGGDMDFGGGFDFWDHIFSYKNSRINYKFTYLYLKVHIFWEGHKILWNLPPYYSTYSQK